jgi:hypothetical protein
MSKWCGKLSPARPSCASKSKSVRFLFKMVSMVLSQRNLSEAHSISRLRPAMLVE